MSNQFYKKCLYQSNLIKEIFLTVAKTVGAQAEVKMELLTKSSHISEDVEVVKIIKRVMSSVGLKQNVGIICGGTDACSYNEKGIDTAGYRDGKKQSAAIS